MKKKFSAVLFLALALTLSGCSGSSGGGGGGDDPQSPQVTIPAAPVMADPAWTFGDITTCNQALYIGTVWVYWIDQSDNEDGFRIRVYAPNNNLVETIEVGPDSEIAETSTVILSGDQYFSAYVSAYNSAGESDWTLAQGWFRWDETWTMCP